MFVMQRFIYLLFLLCVIIFNNPLWANESYKLLVFGDSLSAGYGLNKNESFAAQLQEALIDDDYTQVIVLNDSKSGETTRGGLRRIHQALQKNPNGIIIELGVNDVIRGESIETIKNNLSQLIEICQQKNIAVLLAGMKAPPITEPYYAQQFANIYLELGKKYNILVYPFFMRGIFGGDKYTIISGTRFLLPDKAHPTSQGVSRMVEDIMPTIEKFLKQQGVTSQ